jgi:hypothetical protein
LQSRLLDLGEQLGVAGLDLLGRAEEDWQATPDRLARWRIGAEVERPTLGHHLGIGDGVVHHLHQAGHVAQSRHIGEGSPSGESPLTILW